MNAENKKFILEKLIPFILREQGRGFDMCRWRKTGIISKTYFNHELSRKVRTPACGAVACIGGSVGWLTGKSGRIARGRALGLNVDQCDGLFYGWIPGRDSHGWPTKFIKAHKRATTAMGKAKVAVALLKEVVRTEGKCLELK